MTRTIVCYGDSNTHGASPVDGTRLPRDVRGPGVLRVELGDGFEVIEEALSGRTTVWDSPLAPGRNGRDYLQPCLWSHEPVDLVIIMLGTNDLKRVYGVTANEIASGAGLLVDLVRQSLAGPGATPPAVMLVSPVPLSEATDRSEVWGFGAARDESRLLADRFATIARGRMVPFFDAGSVAEVSPLDGVHLDADAHRSLGIAIAPLVRETLGSRSIP
jgi:lysophospholipase L1-like esterase